MAEGILKQALRTTDGLEFVKGHTMRKAVIYIHGKGGSIKEAFHYRSLFTDSDVMGFDYKARSPWEAKKEFPRYFDRICRDYFLP